MSVNLHHTCNNRARGNHNHQQHRTFLENFAIHTDLSCIYTIYPVQWTSWTHFRNVWAYLNLRTKDDERCHSDANSEVYVDKTWQLYCTQTTNNQYWKWNFYNPTNISLQPPPQQVSYLHNNLLYFSSKLTSQNIVNTLYETTKVYCYVLIYLFTVL